MPLDATGYSALVVDDDPEVRRIVSRALRAIGFSCDTASDGEMARQKMVIHLPDLLVTDLRMPVRHGHRLLVEALGRKSPPLVAVITGLVEPAIAYDIVSRGAKDVTLKPFNPAVCAAKWLAMLKARDMEASIGGGAEEAPSDTGEPAGERSVAAQLEQTSATLRAQLQEITESFESTIKGLEKQHENLTAGFIGSIRLLTQLMRKFDGAESSHATRVERLADGICRRVNADRDLVRNVRLASLLHDLGQFGMPDSVRVTLPANMTPAQLQAYRHYPEIGATLLSEVQGCEGVVALVVAHAENYDGSGFPKGLSGEDIPLGSRIIRLADGVDTFGMGLDRKTLEERIASHLIEARGTYYDPALLDASFEYLVGSLNQKKSVKCKVSALSVGDILEADLMSPLGHIIARKGATVNTTMKDYVVRIMGDVEIQVQRVD